MLIISEFGGAIWALVSTVRLQDEMVKVMETSFSSYATNKDVAEKWKTLQQQVIFPSAYYKLSAIFNPLTPNDHYSGRTAPLTSKRCILFIYSTNIGTEYFKHGNILSVFFSSKCSFVL